MITKKLVKRFDQYFSKNNNNNKKELRQYIKEYFTIIREVSDAYVPRIFVMRQIESGYHVTAAVWTMNNPTVFPPTDFIVPVLYEDNVDKSGFDCWADTKSLLETLSPHLHEVNSFSFLKKLSYDYEYTKEIEQLVKTVTKPIPILRVEILTVDQIPTTQEELIYYKIMPRSSIKKGRLEAVSRVHSGRKETDEN